MTWKLTMKNMGPIPIANSILPYTSRRVPSKALMNMVVGEIRKVSAFKRSIVLWTQSYLHTLTWWAWAKYGSLPSGGSSSFVKEIWLVVNTVETIPSKEDSMTPAGTHVSFKTFKRALWWTSEDSNSTKMEIWAGDLFSYWITLYSKFLIIFKNSTPSLIVTLFLTSSTVHLPISFLLFSSSSGV